MVGFRPNYEGSLSQADRIWCWLGVAGRLTFGGERSDAARLRGVSDLGLRSSEMASFGFAGLDAMAGGAVPPAPCGGGRPEVVTDGRVGILGPADATEAMAAAEALLLPPPPLAALARFGSESVIKRSVVLAETHLG